MATEDGFATKFTLRPRAGQAKDAKNGGFLLTTKGNGIHREEREERRKSYTNFTNESVM